MSIDEENERLLTAMKNLARTRDEASRKQMYRALLAAELYVPLTVHSEGAVETRFAQDEPLHGKPVYVVFTSLATLRRWQEEPGEHSVLKGDELFTLLAKSDIGSCLINPLHKIRGELYRHEVQMLAEAVTRLKAWRGGRTMN